MRYINILMILFLLGIICGGCLTVEKYSVNFNYKTGKATIVYHNICSRKDLGENDYSVENDWKLLEKGIKQEKEKYDKDVIECKTVTLFNDNGVLSAKEELLVKCPKCFPTKASILKRIHQDWERLDVKDINGDILLVLPKSHSKSIISSNGRNIDTEKNSIAIWPSDQEEFKYEINERDSGGKSLLKFYENIEKEK